MKFILTQDDVDFIGIPRRLHNLVSGGRAIPAHELDVRTLTAFCSKPQVSGVLGEVVLKLVSIRYEGMMIGSQAASFPSIDGKDRFPPDNCSSSDHIFIIDWEGVSSQ